VLKIHPDLIYFYILYLDVAGDKILIESKENLPPNCRDYEATRDLFTIIHMNKSKCLAGEPIPLYIMDLSQTNSPTVVSPTDSTVITSYFHIIHFTKFPYYYSYFVIYHQMAEPETVFGFLRQHSTDFGKLDSDLQSILASQTNIGLWMAQQDKDNKRRFQILQLGQENIAKQLAIITSNQNKKDHQENDSAALMASLEKIETKIKEQNAEIKQLPANLLAVLNDSRKCT